MAKFGSALTLVDNHSITNGAGMATKKLIKILRIKILNIITKPIDEYTMENAVRPWSQYLDQM